MEKKAAKLRITVPGDLFVEASRVAPRSVRRDPSRIIERALRLWVDTRKERLVDLAVARMGRDHRVLADCRKINREFAPCDADGLRGL